MTSSKKKRSQRFKSAMAVISVFTSLGIAAFFILIYYWAGEIYDYQDTVDGAHLPQVDAIVCLAGGRGRIAAAGDLWYRYWEYSQKSGPILEKVPVLYFSGMGPQAKWNIVAKQLRRGVLSAIREESVVIEKESLNTGENALWLSQYAEIHHWRRILLLTSGYHMKRARFIFEQVLKGLDDPIQLETISVYQEPFVPEEWRAGPNGIRVTLIEYLKWVYYRSFWKPAWKGK